MSRLPPLSLLRAAVAKWGVLRAVDRAAIHKGSLGGGSHQSLGVRMGTSFFWKTHGECLVRCQEKAGVQRCSSTGRAA